jgi:hypothetical protein
MRTSARQHILENPPATEGATMGPPADMEYAVEPLGVEMINPSAWGAANISVRDGSTRIM